MSWEEREKTRARALVRFLSLSLSLASVKESRLQFFCRLHQLLIVKS